MERAIKEILKNIEGNKSDIPHFPKNGYAPVMISKDKFHPIKNIGTCKKIAFIDGGNQEIIGSANFSLQFIRVYSCIYQDNKRISKETFETFALITAKKIGDELNYSINLFSQDIKDFNFGIYDESLKVGSHKVSIGSVGDAARKFLEIITAKKACKNADFVVMDRNLEATVTGEKELLDQLYLAAKENKATVCALSKTSTLLTESGNSVPAILQNLGPENNWYYHPLARITNPNHEAEIFLARLHEKSKHIFRIDVHSRNEFDIDELLSLLSLNSKDPIFLGYPYGLVEADRFARVSNKETEMLKTQVFVRLGRDFEKIRSHLNTRNAHDILDSIG